MITLVTMPVLVASKGLLQQLLLAFYFRPSASRLPRVRHAVHFINACRPMLLRAFNLGVKENEYHSVDKVY